MSAPTLTRSAYPAPVAALLPQAVQLAEELGRMPSLNRLKAELRIGTDKARAVRAAVADVHGGVPDADAPEADEPIPSTVADTDQARSGTDPVPVPRTPDSTEPSGTDLPAEPPEPAPDAPLPLQSPLVGTVEHAPAEPDPASPTARPVRSWPLLLLALPAFVAIWSGWVGLGGLTGFGIVHPLPGIVDRLSLNTAITLPIGVETYAAYALRVWLSAGIGRAARRFAKWSAIGSLALGAAGQMAYHLMAAQGVTHAPWPITTLVAALPVAVVGMGAALAHLARHN
jgi:hypothetical protein